MYFRARTVVWLVRSTHPSISRTTQHRFSHILARQRIGASTAPCLPKSNKVSEIQLKGMHWLTAPEVKPNGEPQQARLTFSRRTKPNYNYWKRQRVPPKNGVGQVKMPTQSSLPTLAHNEKSPSFRAFEGEKASKKFEMATKCMRRAEFASHLVTWWLKQQHEVDVADGLNAFGGSMTAVMTAVAPPRY